MEIINLPTLKPLDLASIQNSLTKTKAVMILSEEQLGSGLNAYLAQQLLNNLGEKNSKPLLTEFVAVNNTFGESGTAQQLLSKYHLDSQAILNKTLLLLKKKRKLLSI